MRNRRDKVVGVHKFDKIHVQKYAMIALDEAWIIFFYVKAQIVTGRQKNYGNVSVLVANALGDLNSVKRLHKNIENDKLE